MLFHVTHIHNWQSCPAGNPDLIRETFGTILSNDNESGVNLIGAYVDAPAHTVFFLVETDDIVKLHNLFEPALKLGHAEIRPVEDGLAAIKRRL